MNFWSPFPFVRITLVFAVGVLLAFSPLAEYGLSVWILVTISLILFGVRFFIRPTGRWLIGNVALVVIALLGFKHALNSVNLTDLPDREVLGYSGQIISKVEKVGKRQRVTLLLDHFMLSDSVMATTAKVLIYIEEDSLRGRQFSYGDHLLIRSRPNTIKPPNNPGEFDFAAYWRNKDIQLQDFVKNDEVLFLKNDPQNIVVSHSIAISKKCEDILTEAITNERELAIALALIVGIKDELDSNVKEAYAAAGAMHVLAVSGLHVGILYLFILSVFKPVRTKKNGEFFVGLLSLVVLWLYAFVTGFSPSVQRAVVMFSVFIVGRMFKRRRNIYNSMALSAFILMLINPAIIYEVGFQLSYLAVFGIVFLQPKIYQLWSPQYWLTNKIWEISCVSIAAQLATFPLGIYYFHQFPTLFLVSNLVVIPAAFISLILGISLLFFGFVGLPFYELIGKLLQSILWLMNESVLLIDSVGFSLLDHLHLDFWQVILVYISILFVVGLFLYKQFKHFLVSAACVVAIGLIELRDIQMRNTVREIVFYDVNRKTVIDFREGFTTALYQSDTISQEKTLSYIISPHRLTSGLKSRDIPMFSFDNWNSPGKGIQIKVWNDLKFMRLSGGEWNDRELTNLVEVDYLIISNNSVDDLSTIENLFSFRSIILDSSNLFFRSRKLKAQAESLGLVVHSTAEDGALIVTI